MTYAVTLIGTFQHCIRTSAEVENLVRTYTQLAVMYCTCYSVKDYNIMWHIILRWYQWRE